MSYTHPKSNPLDVIDSYGQEEIMGKNPFLYFYFD